MDGAGTQGNPNRPTFFMITLNTAYQSLRSSAMDLNTQTKVKSATVAQLSSGVAQPEDTGSASFVYKLRTTVTRERSIAAGMVNAISFLDAQAGALQHIYKNVARMDELATRMQDPLQSSADPDTGAQPDLENYMAEFTKLADEIWDTRQASFNGKSLMYVSGARTTLRVALSADGKRTMDLTQSDFSTEPTWRYVLGTTSAASAPGRDPATVYVSTRADVMDPTVMGAIGFENLLADIAQKLASNGAQRSRLERGVAHARGVALGTEAAASVVGDTDVARAVNALVRTDVLTQGALAVRTQANVLSDAALSVLTGSSRFGA